MTDCPTRLREYYEARTSFQLVKIEERGVGLLVGDIINDDRGKKVEGGEPIRVYLVLTPLDIWVSITDHIRPHSVFYG